MTDKTLIKFECSVTENVDTGEIRLSISTGTEDSFAMKFTPEKKYDTKALYKYAATFFSAVMERWAEHIKNGETSVSLAILTDFLPEEWKEGGAQ